MDSVFNHVANETALHRYLPHVVEVLDWVAAAISLFAILLLVIGALRFMIRVVGAELGGAEEGRQRRTNRARLELGGYILAGLELFIVSDVIHTALSLEFASLLFLLMLVVIRAIISYFLDRELAELRHTLD
ncbi:DUF1622 domain-containing protein [Antarctobacter jejuensis]|uniref:DUF1622 domain-containing protein n=1 Tax=Antarctobacter jejuensis TaxID=1439938 RepID=UPI003FD44155